MGKKYICILKRNKNSVICSANAQKTEIAAKNALQIESGKDTNILGSTVQGDKVTAKIGGNLHIETLQEKETYEEKNTSAGFNLSWDVSRIKGAQKYSKPTIGASISKGNIFSGRPHFISTSFNPPFEPFFFARDPSPVQQWRGFGDFTAPGAAKTQLAFVSL